MEGSSKSSNESFDLINDDLYIYLSSLMLQDEEADHNPRFFPDEDEISYDELYAHQLQLQETLMISSSSPQQVDDPSKLSPLPEIVSCLICLDPKPLHQMFQIKICSHQFCSDCMQQHLATKIQQKTGEIMCPSFGCGGTLDPLTCRSILSEPLLDQWESVLCELTINDLQKFYCPFEDCSNMLVDEGGERVTSSECPNCRRLFCAQCRVPWHSEMDCGEFEASRDRDDNDAKAMELAERENWRRCPKCQFYVEKADGCWHITCRCKFEFCYGCGSEYVSGHECSDETDGDDI